MKTIFKKKGDKMFMQDGIGLLCIVIMLFTVICIKFKTNTTGDVDAQELKELVDLIKQNEKDIKKLKEWDDDVAESLKDLPDIIKKVDSLDEKQDTFEDKLNKYVGICTDVEEIRVSVDDLTDKVNELGENVKNKHDGLQACCEKNGKKIGELDAALKTTDSNVNELGENVKNKYDGLQACCEKNGKKIGELDAALKTIDSNVNELGENVKNKHDGLQACCEKNGKKIGELDASLKTTDSKVIDIKKKQKNMEEKNDEYITENDKHIQNLNEKLNTAHGLGQNAYDLVVSVNNKLMAEQTERKKADETLDDKIKNYIQKNDATIRKLEEKQNETSQVGQVVFKMAQRLTQSINNEQQARKDTDEKLEAKINQNTNRIEQSLEEGKSTRESLESVKKMMEDERTVRQNENDAINKDVKNITAFVISNANDIETIKNKQSDDIEKIKNKHNEDIEKLLKQHADDIEKLKNKYDEDIQNLKDAMKVDIASTIERIIALENTQTDRIEKYDGYITQNDKNINDLQKTLTLVNDVAQENFKKIQDEQNERYDADNILDEKIQKNSQSIEDIKNKYNKYNQKHDGDIQKVKETSQKIQNYHIAVKKMVEEETANRQERDQYFSKEIDKLKEEHKKIGEALENDKSKRESLDSVKKMVEDVQTSMQKECGVIKEDVIHIRASVINAKKDIGDIKNKHNNDMEKITKADQETWGLAFRTQDRLTVVEKNVNKNKKDIIELIKKHDEDVKKLDNDGIKTWNYAKNIKEDLQKTKQTVDENIKKINANTRCVTMLNDTVYNFKFTVPYDHEGKDIHGLHVLVNYLNAKMRQFKDNYDENVKKITRNAEGIDMIKETVYYTRFKTPYDEEAEGERMRGVHHLVNYLSDKMRQFKDNYDGNMTELHHLRDSVIPSIKTKLKNIQTLSDEVNGEVKDLKKRVDYIDSHKNG